MTITRTRSFWIVYAIASLVALVVAIRLFPLAIPIVNLDIKMSRDEAIAAARTLATRLALAPDGARAVARFAHDATTRANGPLIRSTSSSKAAANAHSRR